MTQSSRSSGLQDVSFDWEAQAGCPLCHGSVMLPAGRVCWLEIDFWYVICPTCNLKFMNPRPTQASYQRFYKTQFWQQKVRNLGFHQDGQMWNMKRYTWDNERRWDAQDGLQVKIAKARAMRTPVIIDTLGEHLTLGADTHVLEVGAGLGVVLEELHARHGCRVSAIEPSTEARAVFEEGAVIESLGEYAEELERLRHEPLRFHAIIFSHSLENMSAPFDILQWASECLRPHGVIYIQCANLFTFDQMNPYHPFIFCERALRVAADRLGMTLERSGDPTDRMLTVVLRSRS